MDLHLACGKRALLSAIETDEQVRFVADAGDDTAVRLLPERERDGAAGEERVAAEDAAKIQRISDRFELGKVDKASIVSEAEKAVADREAAANEVPTKSRGEIIVEEAMGKPMQKEGNSHQNPSVAKTDKSPLSERDLETTGTHTDKGVAKAADKKPSVKEKLDRYKAAAKAEKEAERTVPEVSKEKPKTPEANRQTVHRQPKKSKKPKER